MTDTLTIQERSLLMAKIRGKNTRPEIAVRSLLHRAGYRFRIHVSSLPGKPDIVLPRFRTVVFVHGCFWHRHGCKYSTFPSTRQNFWQTKFEGNVQRDKDNQARLTSQGWRVFVLWECEINSWDLYLEHRIKTFISNGSVNVEVDF